MDVRVTHLSVEVAALLPGDMIVLDNKVCEVIKIEKWVHRGVKTWIVETFWFDENFNKRFYSKNVGVGTTEVPWLVFRAKHWDHP